MKLRFAIFTVALVVMALFGMTVLAQSETLVDGLDNPRQISFDADGNLYVAEAGNGGPLMTSSDTPFGATGKVTMVAPDGTTSTVLQGLISYREGNSLGSHAVLAADGSLWVLLGETEDFSIPYTHALIEINQENGRIQNWIDLLALELDEDPDGNPNQQSNPTDFAVAEDGTIYIANAGCNCLMSWTEADGLQVAAVWPFEGDNPVPTTVDVGPDGDIYVGFLTGFPWPQGESRIERWSGGELVQTYEGLTAVTGLEVTDDGTIYAVEFGVFDQGWGPGRVVRVTDSGIETVVDGLESPYGIAQAPDGSLAVTTGASSGEGSGTVITIPMS